MNALRRLSLAASLTTFGLLVVGATVSATGAGLACPDWPLCQGRLIPPLERLVMIEYAHRLLASTVGVMMLALAVLVWRGGRDRGLRRRMAGLLALLAIQVGLGGVTVLSALKPVVVGVHLATAMAFLALLVAFAARVQWESPGSAGFLAVGSRSPDVTGLRGLVHAALGVTFLQIVLGGFTSAFGAGLACPDLPLCHGRLLPAAPLAALHVAHRVVGVIVIGLVVAAAARARRSSDAAVRSIAAAAAALAVAQAALGILNVWTGLAAPVRVAHLAGGAALLGTLIMLLVRSRLEQHALTGGRSRAPGGVPAAARGSVATRSRAAPSRGIVRTAADYLSLTKPRIIILLLTTTITTMVVAAGGVKFGLALAFYTMLGGALAAGAANAINCYWDRDIDAIMRRTRGRPVPSGRVTPHEALVFGVLLAAASVLVLGVAVNWLSAALALAGVLFYVGVYTIWLKRATPQNIVIGGAAGAIPPLVGWAAVTNQVGLPAMLLFAIIFLWTPPHFWALAINREDEYRAAGVPMLPVVRGPAETLRQMLWYTLALVGSTLVLAGLGVLGRVYLFSAVLLDIPFILLVLRLARQTTPRAAWALFEYSIAYLGLLFAAMALDRLLV